MKMGQNWILKIGNNWKWDKIKGWKLGKIEKGTKQSKNEKLIVDKIEIWTKLDNFKKWEKWKLEIGKILEIGKLDGPSRKLDKIQKIENWIISKLDKIIKKPKM